MKSEMKTLTPMLLNSDFAICTIFSVSPLYYPVCPAQPVHVIAFSNLFVSLILLKCMYKNRFSLVADE